MANSPILLFDNSWHVYNPDESIYDSFGRKAVPLSGMKGTTQDNVRSLASYTIGELMEATSDTIYLWPDREKEVADDLKKQNLFKVTEKDGKNIASITTNNIVGFIGCNDTDIRIRSRFSQGNDDYFLYYMMEKVLAVNMVNFETSTSRKDAIFDLMFLFFPKLLKEALSQGVYKQYVYHEYNDANVKGAIDINRHIRFNIPFNGRIAYRTREFSYDNPVTQLIRHTIEFIRRKPFGQSVLHNDAETEGCIQQIILATPTYNDRQRQAVINDNLRPFTHPYFTKYAALIKLCLRILRHEQLAYGDNKDEKVYGVLIDAAWLWEEYVAGVINSIGGNHYTRKNSKYNLFHDDEGDFQQIVPDYVKGEENNCDWVADAKYIPLAKERHLYADKAERVYYKTIMYMYRFNTDIGFLLHPVKPGEDTSSKDITSSTYNILGGRGGRLHKIGIVIPQPEESKNYDYSAFKGDMHIREQKFSTEIDRLKNGV